MSAELKIPIFLVVVISHNANSDCTLFLIHLANLVVPFLPATIGHLLCFGMRW